MTNEELLFMMYIEDQEKKNEEYTVENESNSSSWHDAPNTEKNN